MILIISGTNVISGAEYVLKDYLEKSGRAKEFVILSSNEKTVKEFYKNIGFYKEYYSKHLLPKGVLNRKSILGIIKKVYSYLSIFILLFKILRINKIEIVLGNNSFDIIYSLLVKKIFKKQFILYVHDVIEYDTLIGKVFKLFDKFVDQYITVSKSNKQHLLDLGIVKEKIEVVYNGLEYKKCFKEKKDFSKWVFGFVGAIDERKNPLLFIKIIEYLSKNIDNIIGKIVYNRVDKNLMARLKDQVREKNLNIEFIRELKRNEMDDFYSQIDFLVLTSKNDPFPTVVLEAFNNGVPVIATPVDGLPEMIDDMKTGIFFSKFEDIKKIEIFIEKYKKNYKKISFNTNKVIENRFNINNKIKKLNKILKI